MKKLLGALLVAIMIAMVTACGASENTESSAEKDVEATVESNSNEDDSSYYSVGESASNDCVEITLNSVEFESSRLEAASTIIPEDGQKFVTIEFTIRNIGKTELGYFKKPGGNSKQIKDMPYVDYNDGYTFMISDVDAADGKTYMTMMGFFFDPNEGNLTSDLKVLGEALVCTGSIVVPEEVVTNEDAPLLIGFNVPTENDEGQIVYKIR